MPFRLNVPMVRQRVRRLLARRHVEFRSLATREWTLCPSHSACSAPAVMLAGTLERIQAFSPLVDPQHEMAMIRGDEVQHDALVAYLIENVNIRGSVVYAGAARMQAGFAAERLVSFGAPGPVARLEAASLRSTYNSTRYFGCLLLDAAPLELVADESPGIVLGSRPYAHHRAYWNLLGLDGSRQTERAHVRRLTMFSDHAQNESKRRRYCELRTRMRARLGPSSERPLVYIGRGTAGEPRELVNEQDVVAALRNRGFRIVEPDTMTAEQIARATLGAQLVVGVEGSQLAHAIYTMADDGAFLVIQPPSRVAMAFKEFADCVGQPFGMVVADAAVGGFSMPVDMLFRMVDRMLASPRPAS